jgi:hypothetical protein
MHGGTTIKMIKIVYRSSCKIPIILVRFKLNSSFLDILSKSPHIPNFMKIRQVGAELSHANGRTDMTRLIIAFLSFANAPKNLTKRSAFISRIKIGIQYVNDVFCTTKLLRFVTVP